jgi:hypothetical protein
MINQELGGVKTPRRIIDQQRGTECGYEAVENALQLISERDLKIRAARQGYALSHQGKLYLDIRGYKPLLRAYGIESSWVPFDWATLTGALRENRVAIAVVDPHLLDPKSYSAGGDLHAIVVTNFLTDVNRNLLGYVGIDSNFGEQERRWQRERFEAAVVATGGWILLTNGPIHPTYWATYEVVTYGMSGFRIVASQTT